MENTCWPGRGLVCLEERKPTLTGFYEIYQGWRGNLGMETLGSWVLEVAILDLSLKNDEGE